MTKRSFIPMAVPVLDGREMEFVADAVQSGWISSQGKYVTAFEETFAAYCGVEHGIAVTSGTTALHLALVSIGVGQGDEVIIPSLTHIAVATAVTLTGATIVLADSEPDTWNIDPIDVKAKMSPRTKAIIVVHLYGHPVDMDPILELADGRDVYVIEDAAESHGAEYKNRRTGGLAHLSCFSFYANKIITTGEGGMVLTDDPDLAARARKLHDQAYEPERRFWHKELGFNYRMTNLQAALGLAQLEQIEKFLETRRQNAQTYRKPLTDLAGITLPVEKSWAKNVYWMYSILIEDSFGLTRDEVVSALKDQGIESRSFFWPVHLQPLYSAQFVGQDYPVSTHLAATGLNLPSGNELTSEEVNTIALTIASLHRA